MEMIASVEPTALMTYANVRMCNAVVHVTLSLRPVLLMCDIEKKDFVCYKMTLPFGMHTVKTTDASCQNNVVQK